MTRVEVGDISADIEQTTELVACTITDRPQMTRIVMQSSKVGVWPGPCSDGKK